MKQTIPVLNLQDFVGASADSRARFVRELGDSLSDTGFFALEGHGVPDPTIRGAYEIAEELFRMPDATKARYDHGKGGQRGYTSFGKEHAKNSDAPDLKEF